MLWGFQKGDKWDKRSFVPLMLLWTVVFCLPVITWGQSFEATEKTPLEQADALFNEGKAQQALSLYQWVLSENPAEVRARIGLARIALARLQFGTAQQELERGLKKAPKNTSLLAALANVFVQKAAYQQYQQNPSPSESPAAVLKKAQDVINKAMAVGSNNPVVLTAAGDLSLAKGDSTQALGFFEQALTHKSDYGPAYHGLTRYHLRQKDFYNAKLTAFKALELNPTDSEGYFLMAILFDETNHPEQAGKYALLSERYDPGITLARDVLLADQFERQGQLEQAQMYYERILAQLPHHPDTLQKLANLHEKQGHEEESLAFFEKVIQIKPAYLVEQLNTAYGDLRVERRAEALPVFQKILKLSGRAPSTEGLNLTAEAFHGLASAFYLDWFYGQKPPSFIQETAQQLADYRQSLSASDPQTALLALDDYKIQLAMAGKQMADVRQKLLSVPRTTVASQPEALLAQTEALFFLGDYHRAGQVADQLEGQTAEVALRMGDRLLLDQALNEALVLYQRAYPFASDPALKQALEQGIQRATKKRELSQRRVDEGNAQFQQKNFPEAERRYQEAAQIYPSWQIPYLRLGDLYERQKQPAKAYEAYGQALKADPSLGLSKSFVKKREKLQKKASKAR